MLTTHAILLLHKSSSEREEHTVAAKARGGNNRDKPLVKCNQEYLKDKMLACFLKIKWFP